MFAARTEFKSRPGEKGLVASKAVAEHIVEHWILCLSTVICTTELQHGSSSPAGAAHLVPVPSAAPRKIYLT